jgi:hypothetical protein
LSLLSPRRLAYLRNYTPSCGGVGMSVQEPCRYSCATTQAANATRQALTAMIEMTSSVVVFAPSDPRFGTSSASPYSSYPSRVCRRGRPRRVRDAAYFAEPISVDAIGGGELLAALASGERTARAPHRERPVQYRLLPALLAHEDDPPRRTVHGPTPSLSCRRSPTSHTREVGTTLTPLDVLDPVA